MKLPALLVFATIPAADVLAQAPRAAALWDVPATTLAGSPALETGATAMFWNPAAVLGSRGFRVGAQAIETPDVVGLGGVVLGITHPLNSRLAVGLSFGRVQIGDLVRTSTSPAAEPGDIPVYEQTGGVAVGARIGPVSLAALVRGHDARFDIFRETGLSADLGTRIEATPRLTVAGATRFLPIPAAGDAPARYYGGVEFIVLDTPAWGAPARMVARYGLLAQSDAGLEHAIGAGVELASRIRLDLSCARENAYDDPAWRMVLALGIRAGRYDILAARGSGIHGVGANYRVGLEVDFTR
jgi:hypothetical protein